MQQPHATIADPEPEAPSLTPTTENAVDRGNAPRAKTGGPAMLVGLLAFPFLIVTMMYASYVGTMHSPQVRDLPVAVVGTDADVRTTAAFEALTAVPDQQVAPRLVESAEQARELLEDREVAAVVAPPADESEQATVYVAGAAGPSKAQTVQALVLPATAGLGWTAEVEDVAPLPSGDTSGTVVMFAAMAMMLAGYVPLSLMMIGTPHLLRVRRFVPVLAAWSVVVPTVIWLLLGPLVGGVDGHYLAFLGVGALTIAAVGSVQLFLTKLAGPLAVLIGMLLLVVLGMPASNLSLPIESMPSFFRFLHGVLPLPAAGESLRSLVYFDGSGVAPHLLTLAAGLVIGLGAAVLVERKKGDVILAASKYETSTTPLPAMPGGPVRSKRTRYIAAAAFPGSMIVLMVGLMGLSMHAPKVSDMPVLIVGDTTASADATASGLQQSLGDVVDLDVAASVADADAAIRSGDAVAAFVLPGVAGDTATLRTASAMGTSQQNAVSAIFTQIAAAQEMPLDTVDVAPLNQDDRSGTTSMYMAMAWVMAGFLICAVLRGGAPQQRTVREQLPILAGWAVGMSAWLWVLLAVLIGAVHGNAAAYIGLGALTIFAVSMAASIFTRTIGMAAVPVIVVALMLLGVPASGGGLSLYMVPEIFRTLHDVLPLPAAVDIVRSLYYLDGGGLLRPVAVLAAWGAVALGVNLVLDRWIRRRPVNLPPARYLPAS